MESNNPFNKKQEKFVKTITQNPEIEQWPKEKKVQWEEQDAILKQVEFNHGENGIEENIRETVIVLNLLKLNTTESCEGHTDHGSNVPFVILEPEAMSQIYNEHSNSIKEIYLNMNLLEQKDFLENVKKEVEAMKLKMQKYLDEFNKKYPNDPYNFAISEFTPGRSFLIAPKEFFGKTYKPEYREAMLVEARKKTKAFTEFLKEKYLAE